MGIPKFFRWISERYPMLNRPIPNNITPEFGMCECSTRVKHSAMCMLESVVESMGTIVSHILTLCAYVYVCMYVWMRVACTLDLDNLYLDMNGIIHNCTHPNDADPLKQQLTQQEMMINVFKYLDKLFDMIRPRKLLFMAIDGMCAPAPASTWSESESDGTLRNQHNSRCSHTCTGVAPRAKMNQQRARRFRSARDTQEALQSAKARGKAPQELSQSEMFDSNCITPGML
jgi:5'-3' exonuclease